MDTIIKGLKPLAMPLAKLTLDPNNARQHPTQNMAALKESLSRFGQRQVVVVQREGMKVIAGNARVTAALDLGWTHIAAVVVDDDDPRAMAYALADNRTAELALWNLETLCGQLDEISQLGDPDLPVTSLGWNETELELLLSADWTPPAIDPSVEPFDPSDKAAQIKLDPDQLKVARSVVLQVRERQGDFTMSEGEALSMALIEWQDDNGKDHTRDTK